MDNDLELQAYVAGTPEEIAKSKADVAQLNKDIELALQQTPKFTPAATAVAKIKAFIK
jgi:hypothetical protein